MSYSSRPLSSKLFQLTALTLALTLAGCGGGDGTDTIAPTPDLGPEQPGNGGGSDGGEQNVEEINIVESALYNADGNVINSVNLEGAYYQIKVVDNAKNPIINAKVVFDIDAEGISLSQTTSGAVLTDAEGIAQIFLKPDNAEVSGAYTISANATYNQQTATADTTFSVQATNVTLSEITVGSNSLASGGQTPISLKVTNEAGDALSGVLVNFNSGCGQIPEQVTSDSEGMVKAVFKAINLDTTLCSGLVRVSARTGNQTKSTTITVASAEATSIIYTSDDLSLGIRGSGSSSTGQAEFTVYSGSTTLANEQVRVSLEKSPFGLTFGPNRNQQSYVATTDANGQIIVPIFPGTTPGPVEIEVSLVDDPLINALSKNITVASSRVTQTGLSLSWEKNVLDWSYDGDSTQINARMVDRNGNKVPDGTVINFTAEGGKITSSCATVDGNCTVTFTTQNPRPGDGRVSILAVAEGEKEYIDMNENNAWDEGVDILVHNIGDTFRDDNESGEFEIGEFTYPMTTGASNQCKNNLDRYINLKFPSLSELKKRQYEANYISEFVSPNKANTCNTGLDTVVRYQGITLLSNGNDARFTVGNLDQGGNFTVRPSQDIFSSDTLISFRVNSGGFYDLSPMPSGTTISGAGIDQTSADPTAKIVAVENGYVIEVADANPKSSVIVKVGEIEYTITTNSRGQGVSSKFVNPPEGEISVESKNNTCEATLSGVTKVPANVATGMPGDNLGTFTTFKLKNCQATDEVKITATAPSGNVTSYTYTIR
ncbi:Ig-like domain-containing protein [Psychrobacter sp. VH5]|uniref:Ig-like domain-containing protein n=1 Tax=Psychrobacter sp. VH5 TaxID=3423439 RepID=UPI003D65AD7B